MNEFFRRFAHKSSAAFGSSWAFIFALMIVSDEELAQLQKEFEALSKRHSNRIHNIVEGKKQEHKEGRKARSRSRD